MDDTISYYSQNAEHFQQLYDSVEAENVHASWSHILKEREPGTALDVGAGSGRDARWLASLGWRVVAAEPAVGLRKKAQKMSSDNLRWCSSKLPELVNLPEPAQKFDLILLSAVWMHLLPQQRTESIERLATLLAPAGYLILTLRIGPSEPSRPMYPVSFEEAELIAKQNCLSCRQAGPDMTDDLGRENIKWSTVICQGSKCL